MWNYLLSNRNCILDGALNIMIGIELGQGNIGQAIVITVIGVLVISTLQVWKREELE